MGNSGSRNFVIILELNLKCGFLPTRFFLSPFASPSEPGSNGTAAPGCGPDNADDAALLLRRRLPHPRAEPQQEHARGVKEGVSSGRKEGGGLKELNNLLSSS